MEEASEFFNGYYHQLWESVVSSEDVAPTEEGLLDLYLSQMGKEHAAKVCSQLLVLINGPLNDDKLGDFIFEELGSDYVDDVGDEDPVRKWLTWMRDYLLKRIEAE